MWQGIIARQGPRQAAQPLIWSVGGLMLNGCGCADLVLELGSKQVSAVSSGCFIGWLRGR